ncbi:MAG: hypothetical protein K5912_03525 [Alphaproteobacteria bacterium]|nr:hypothetical protein [Alphaproteobacteria bacterium]
MVNTPIKPVPEFQLDLTEKLILALAKKYDKTLRLYFVYVLSCDGGKYADKEYNRWGHLDVYTFSKLKNAKIFYHTYEQVFILSQNQEKLYKKYVGYNARLMEKFNVLTNQANSKK